MPAIATDDLPDLQAALAGVRSPDHLPAQVTPPAFDLDIRVLEFGKEADKMIRLTDDGCGSSCFGACITNA